jgi:peptidoglycan L-alanyl-D-glutamate endopeptidase CwlK
MSEISMINIPKYPFGKTSKRRLDTCHQDIQKIWHELSKLINCSVFCGHRKEAAQNKAFLDGLSQLQWPDSKHNSLPSTAIDSGPYFPEIRNTDWKDYKAFARFAGFVEVISLQLYAVGETTHLVRWGGDWDMDGRTTDQTFNDLVHFELYKP